ncbi:MAG: hypothetical protein KJ736_05090 [Candidatus Omnitrophica bacterium]|nr:hypothetical protein [Candidatus Omnitrophota bacterium]
MNNDPKHNKLIIASIALYPVLAICILAFLLKMTPYALIETSGRVLLHRRENIIELKTIKGINVYSYFYWIILIVSSTIFSMSIARMFYGDNSLIKNLRKTICTFILLNFFVIALLQQLNRHNLTIQDHSTIKGKTEIERNLALYKGEYYFALLSKHAVEGWHQADFITSLDCTINPCMKKLRIISYFLYPEVSLRFDNKTPKDHKVFYFLDNAKDFISEKDQVLVNIKDNFILTKHQK